MTKGFRNGSRGTVRAPSRRSNRSRGRMSRRSAGARGSGYGPRRRPFVRTNGPRRGGSGRANERNNLIPPSSFTRSNLGAEREPMMIKIPLASADVASLEAVETAMANGGLTTQNCVARVYFNKSAVAADVTDPLVPVSAASQRFITRVSGFHVQGHSTATSVHLGGGVKKYSATGAYQRILNARETESHLERGVYHTRKLYLPNKAVLENQKGFKLVSTNPPNFGDLTVEYAHVGDFLYSIGSTVATGTGTKATLDLGLIIHSTPNPDYTDNPAVIQPPQIMIIHTNDPSLILQGFNDGPGETTLITAADKDIQLRQLEQGRYSVVSTIANMVPKPAINQLYKLVNPIQIPKSSGGPSFISLAKLSSDLEDAAKPSIRLFEGIHEARQGFNKGAVTSLNIKIPSGLKFEPYYDLDIRKQQCFNAQQLEYGPGDKILIASPNMAPRAIRLDGGESHKQWEDEDFSVIDDNSSVAEAKLNMDKINSGLRRLQVRNY